MKIYIAIWQDRHTDTTAHPFSDKENAIEWARNTAKKSASRESDYEEEQIEGWEFYSRYSCEGDSIHVVESELIIN